MSKLVLINPVNDSGLAGFKDSVYQKHPPLSLACVAGLTPPDWTVVIEDGLWGPLRFHADADLVGATAFSSMAPAAYAALRPYREAGIPTIIGGIHAWACEIEARKYAGSVLLGEAEDAWWQVIAHAKCGLSPVYHGERQPRFARPRYDLLDPRYELGVVQLSRGCPHCCDFCSVSAFSGREVRRDSIDNVLHNLEAIKQEMVFAVDDNLGGSTAMLREIALAGMGKRFAGQADIAALHDREFLAAARDAGVKMLLVGLESQDHRKNRKTGIDFTLAHEHGIAVLGAWIFGFDTDNREKMLDRARFAVECGADCSQVSMLTPLPGTQLYRYLKDRIVYQEYPADWQYFDFGQMVHCPAGFRSIEEFYDVMLECSQIIYDPATMKSMAKRCWTSTGPEAAAWSWKTNINYATIAAGRAAAWAKEVSC